MRVLFTGGGTGGHIYPALAIAKCLKLKNAAHEVLFVGTKRGLEHDIVPKEGFAFQTITVEGMPRKLSWKMLRTLGKLVQGLWQAKRIIADFKPDVVVATGGYVSGPVALLSAWHKIPVVVHEQNAFPGVTNRILGRWVTRIALTYPETERYFPQEKCLITGNPVRPEVLAAKRADGIKKLNLSPKKKTVLVFGGSRGAHSINQALIDIADLIEQQSDLQVVHVTGANDFSWVSGQDKGIQEVKKGNIIFKPYLYDMPSMLAAADLVICRSGATTLAELTARGIPAILIPYPYATDNHQEYNARTLEKAGAALVLLDKDLQGDVLAESLFNLIRDDEKLKAMSVKCRELGKITAAADIAELVEKLGQAD